MDTALPAPHRWPDSELGKVDHWLESLKSERRLSPYTVSSYARDLEAFLNWSDEQGLDSVQQITDDCLRRFSASQHRAGLAPRSIQRQLSALRTFFRFLMREGVLQQSPAISVRAPKAARRLPQSVDVDRMARLLDAPPPEHIDDDPLWARDHAIVELLYSSGLRLSELVGLDLVDVDVSDATVRVLGKGNKQRIVPLGRAAKEAYCRWLDVRRDMVDDDEQAVFVGGRGRRLGARAVQLRVELWARRQGIDVRMHPHLFRHSFASHLLESSHDLRGVQELLGHANLSTTQIYTHLDFQHLARVYDATHPRAKRRGA